MERIRATAIELGKNQGTLIVMVTNQNLKNPAITGSLSMSLPAIEFLHEPCGGKFNLSQNSENTKVFFCPRCGERVVFSATADTIGSFRQCLMENDKRQRG